MWKLVVERVLTKNKVDDHNTDFLIDLPLLNKMIYCLVDDGSTDLLMLPTLVNQRKIIH